MGSWDGCIGSRWVGGWVGRYVVVEGVRGEKRMWKRKRKRKRRGGYVKERARGTSSLISSPLSPRNACW